MSHETQKTVPDVAQELGRYPCDAFEFLRKGLDFTVQRTHGALAESVRRIHDWLEEEGAEPSDLEDLVEARRVPPSILECIEQVGGVAPAMSGVKLHVSGEELCHGLRVLAMEQWGLLAPLVLRHWGIDSTMDFGRMVFALVGSGLLQKQPHDRIEDFNDVYDFESAFDRAYRIRLTQQSSPAAAAE